MDPDPFLFILTGPCLSAKVMGYSIRHRETLSGMRAGSHGCVARIIGDAAPVCQRPFISYGPVAYFTTGAIPGKDSIFVP